MSDSATTKIDHIPVIQALRAMEQYQEKYFPLEALDASYHHWRFICDYVESRERNLKMAHQLGLPTADKAADILLGKAANVNAFGETVKPIQRKRRGQPR